MRRLELTLPTPAENLACDEALLEWAEEENPAWEFLRLWESPQPLVVVGRSSRVALEVNADSCRQRNIPILRRSSGGAAIVAGPGCLMYALVLSYKLRPELKDIRRAHAHVLSRFAASLSTTFTGKATIAQAGTSDLIYTASDERPLFARKFSGNSLRARRSHLLYHGTLLYDFDLGLIEACLKLPPRQPDYRGQRSHADFVTNLPLARRALVESVNQAWPTQSDLAVLPATTLVALVADKFGKRQWNLEFP
jgi:lipoate-protein ligase A